MPRRVRRPKDKETLFKLLTTDGESKIFNTYKDLFMMAACIGYKYGRREPFEQTSEAIQWPVFNEQSDLPIINSIALMETRDVNILMNDDETFDIKISIVEEYANGGLKLIQEKIIDKPGTVLDNFIGLIQKEQNHDYDDLSGLDGFSRTLFG
jgi:dnd system-associated protein 4